MSYISSTFHLHFNDLHQEQFRAVSGLHSLRFFLSFYIPFFLLSPSSTRGPTGRSPKGCGGREWRRGRGGRKGYRRRERSVTNVAPKPPFTLEISEKNRRTNVVFFNQYCGGIRVFRPMPWCTSFRVGKCSFFCERRSPDFPVLDRPCPIQRKRRAQMNSLL